MRRIVEWAELCRVLKKLGYQELKPGARGGSAVPFQNLDRKPDYIVFHKPHNGGVLRPKVMARRLAISEERFLSLCD